MISCSVHDDGKIPGASGTYIKGQVNERSPSNQRSLLPCQNGHQRQDWHRLHKAPLLSHPDESGNVHFFRKDSVTWAVRHTHTCLFSETFWHQWINILHFKGPNWVNLKGSQRLESVWRGQKHGVKTHMLTVSKLVFSPSLRENKDWDLRWQQNVNPKRKES